jgi:hypothetical protein
VYLNAGLNPAGLAPPAPLPTVVALPVPSPVAPSEAASALAGEPLFRKVQGELARLGCDPGAIDGKWGAKARGALAQFAKLTKASLDPDQPDAATVDALAQRKGRVCPLVCDADEVQQGGRCVTKPVVAKPGPEPKPAAKAPKATVADSAPPSRQRSSQLPKCTSANSPNMSSGQECQDETGRVCQVQGSPLGRNSLFCK